MENMAEMMSADQKTKEYFWAIELGKNNTNARWEGDSQNLEIEQLVLKTACLGVGAKEGERNIVELTSFDHNQEKIKSCICSLDTKFLHTQGLSDICLFPPVKFHLVQGSGPVHITGNHIVLDELDDNLSDEDSEDEEMDELVDSSMDSSKIKEINGNGEDDDEDVDEDDDDVDDDEDDDDDNEDDEEEVKEKKGQPASKKRKMNGKKAVITKNDDSPSKRKSSENKHADSPKSAKKAQKPPMKSIEEVKAAIKKVTGGKPRKQDKFRNWVKNTYKLTDDTWVDDLWKWHKKECGL